MVFHRLGRDEEGPGDLPRGESLGGELGDAALAGVRAATPLSSSRRGWAPVAANFVWACSARTARPKRRHGVTDVLALRLVTAKRGTRLGVRNRRQENSSQAPRAIDAKAAERCTSIVAPSRRATSRRPPTPQQPMSPCRLPRKPRHGSGNRQSAHSRQNGPRRTGTREPNPRDDALGGCEPAPQMARSRGGDSEASPELAVRQPQHTPPALSLDLLVAATNVSTNDA